VGLDASFEVIVGQKKKRDRTDVTCYGFPVIKRQSDGSTATELVDTDRRQLYQRTKCSAPAAAVIKAAISGVLHGADVIAGAAAQQRREVTERLNMANKIACLRRPLARLRLEERVLK